jgi:D-sedoheptulose 7-phosphate isomerase
MSSRSSIDDALADAAASLDRFRNDAVQLANVEAFVHAALRTLDAGRSLLACGNGGSLSQAMHFAEEWTGRFRNTRRALPAIALADPTEITCIANDFGFEEIFARQVEAQGRPGDLLLLLSTSGNSENVIRAARVARDRDIWTVALLGNGGGKLAAEVDLPVVVPNAEKPDTSDRIQEVHLHILHSVIEAVERRLFPDDYLQDQDLQDQDLQDEDLPIQDFPRRSKTK